jgi:hypothetical protein
MAQHKKNPEPIDLDRLAWGAGEISAVIGRSPRQTFYMLERGLLPARKVGRLWSASPRKLLAYLAGEQVDAGEVA